MSVNMSVFFTLCYMVELKEKRVLLSEVFCRHFVSHSADCAVWGLRLQGWALWMHLCLHLSCDQPELDLFSPFQNQPKWSFTKPRVTEISYSQESILLNFYLPLTF